MRISVDSGILYDALKTASATLQHPDGSGIRITAVAPDRLGGRAGLAGARAG